MHTTTVIKKGFVVLEFITRCRETRTFSSPTYEKKDVGAGAYFFPPKEGKKEVGGTCFFPS